MQKIVVGCVRGLFGLALIVCCGYLGIEEFHNPARSIALIVGTALGVLLGALIVPGLNSGVKEGSETGFRLFSFGRRAYDGQVAVVDAAPAPPVTPEKL